jgi:signal transduction histidine kinase
MAELAGPEVTRVVRNLLDNAIRHTPAGGAVTVNAGLDTTGRAVEIWVQDSCGGIPIEDLERVFDSGFRGGVDRTPWDGRSGLGLAAASGLATAHDGQISVSNCGPGCRFTVRLPMSA